MFHDTHCMESPKRVLGIEGGGTKTEWLLLAVEGAEQRVIDRGTLPASNLKLVTDDALARLFSVLPRDATHVGVFLAGCGTDEDRARLRRVVAGAWPDARLALGSDRDSGLATAFAEGDGIAVISGTGAAVHGRRGGRIEKAGGWGQLLGDRGGGYDLAMQGLRLVLTHFDLNQKITPLAEDILRMLALNRLSDLVDWAKQADKMSVARLAPAIFRAAKSGEREILETVQAGASILAEYTRAVAQRLEWPDARVKLIGGMFVHHEEYAALFKYRLSVLLPGASVETCRESGAVGAAWLAGKVTSGERRVASEAVAEARSELAAAATEQSNPRSANLETLATAELIDLFVTEEDCVARALAACRAELVSAVDLVGAAMRAGGRLFYVGAGTSGRLGVLDASEIPPTFGAAPELVQGIIAGGAVALHRAVEGAEDQPEAGALAVTERGVRAGDVVCGLTASGRTPFVLGALARARELGARTLLVTCNPARHRAEQPWDAEIDLPTGPEIVTGSTRLKAGTATKVALNILSTCAMIRLGRVRGNAMVDLNISNEKLRDRGARLVSAALHIPYAEAFAKLAAANWNVRACLESERMGKPG
jgi:N-acetylmuramic acid 6-phosphate etherase